MIATILEVLREYKDPWRRAGGAKMCVRRACLDKWVRAREWECRILTSNVAGDSEELRELSRNLLSLSRADRLRYPVFLRAYCLLLIDETPYGLMKPPGYNLLDSFPVIAFDLSQSGQMKPAEFRVHGPLLPYLSAGRTSWALQAGPP